MPRAANIPTMGEHPRRGLRSRRWGVVLASRERPLLAAGCAQDAVRVAACKRPLQTPGWSCPWCHVPQPTHLPMFIAADVPLKAILGKPGSASITPTMTATCTCSKGSTTNW